MSSGQSTGSAQSKSSHLSATLLPPDYTPSDDEEFMNPLQQEYFRQRLLRWRAELLRESSDTLESMQQENLAQPDLTDRASMETDRSIELRTRDRERKLIKKIDSTIELIAQDDYGYCESCGIEIGIRRLEARPTANKCIDCKTLDEIKEKQLGS